MKTKYNDAEANRRIFDRQLMDGRDDPHMNV